MFSETIRRLSSEPYHMGPPPDGEADATGQQGLPGEGPFMTLYLKQAPDGTLAVAWFQTYGCPTATACGSWICRWLEGRTTEQAMKLEAEDLARVLGGLPLGKEHCGPLAVTALRSALRRLPVRATTAASEAAAGAEQGDRR